MKSGKLFFRSGLVLNQILPFNLFNNFLNLSQLINFNNLGFFN